MNYDISESVSQRGDGAYDEENRRIQEVSNELQRLCRLHEEESGDGKRNGTRFEIENSLRNRKPYKPMDDYKIIVEQSTQNLEAQFLAFE